MHIDFRMHTYPTISEPSADTFLGGLASRPFPRMNTAHDMKPPRISLSRRAYHKKLAKMPREEPEAMNPLAGGN